MSSGPRGAEGNLDKLRSEIEQSGGDASAVLCDVKDGNARSVVHFAAAGGHREVIEFVRSSTDDRCAPRRAAASRHRPHPLFPLSALSALDGMGNTPLSLAVSAGHLDLVRWLVDQGVDVSLRGDGAATPLHRACADAGAPPPPLSLLLPHRLT